MRLGKLKFVKYAGRVATIILVLAGSLGTWVYVRFRHDMAAHEERIALGSHIADTNCGAIEYGEMGSGTPVLVIHGAGGGYDQGVLLGGGLGNGFRVIAPSRFGYLNSPIPADASVTAQADAYVCLLDHLGIQKAAVIAVSAGGTSALQLAQRHPDRVESLIMVSAISNVRPVRQANESAQAALLTDFVYWATVETVPQMALEFFGLSRASQQKLSPEELARAKTLLDTMNPLERRLPGIQRDSVEANLFDGAIFELSKITTPTLVIHASDDTFIPLVHGQYTASHIPGAKLIVYEFGGHFVAGRNDALIQIADFIQRAHQLVLIPRLKPGT